MPLSGGKDPNGSVYHVGKGIVNDATAVGKILGGKLYVSYGGKEHCQDKGFQILVTTSDTTTADEKSEVDELKDDGGVSDENPVVVDTTSPEMKQAFDQVCDANGTIGWYELKDLIGCINLGENSVALDKVICRMLIKAVGSSDTERIGFLGYENAINGLKRSIENFLAVDKDRRGNLDPFEVKNAFSRDRDISYQDVMGLMEAVGQESGKMSLYGFLLADLLLITLSTSEVGIDEDDNPAVLEWMNKQMDFLKSGKPLKDM
ncbi:uncharacterized protein LOC110861288 [Folsomia candida]|uniref:uncharacterized protein LOC110861288 n=1 Tax=Folsomia candida TaxID=158441 RepID=UPI001604AB7E|nr:uncharacterized protein LOC110861288 [Folsomia candida]